VVALELGTGMVIVNSSSLDAGVIGSFMASRHGFPVEVTTLGSLRLAADEGTFSTA
jgi:hypothetical protein